MAAHLRASSLRPCQSSGAVLGATARARSAQNIACCSTIPARAAACAVLVRIWNPAKLEINGPAIRPMASPMAMGLVVAHFAAAVSRMVAVWLLMHPSSSAGAKQIRLLPRNGSLLLFGLYFRTTHQDDMVTLI